MADQIIWIFSIFCIVLYTARTKKLPSLIKAVSNSVRNRIEGAPFPTATFHTDAGTIIGSLKSVVDDHRVYYSTEIVDYSNTLISCT